MYMYVYNVLLFDLFRIHSIPSVPVVDCFQKIRQQIKCYLQMTEMTTAGELQEVKNFFFLKIPT